MRKPTLFVVGCGRSGTTLLYELLCSSPSASWISNYSQRAPFFGRFHPATPKAYKEGRASRFAVRPVEGYRLFDRVHPPSDGVDRREQAEVLSSADVTLKEARQLQRSIGHHLAPRRVTYFVNKNTRNVRRVGYLAAALPDSVFAHITRHPLATAYSLSRVPFFPDLVAPWRGGLTMRELANDSLSPLVLAAELWVQETSASVGALAELTPSRVCEFKYEEFVLDPEARLSEVLALVGENLSTETRELIRSRTPTNRNLVAATQLTAAERSLMWSIVEATAAPLGYSFESL